MSVDEDSRREDALIAGEYALGLLEGEELLAARGRISSEPAFAAQVAWWEKELVNLADGFAGAEPGAHVWERIAADIGTSEAPPSAEVVDLTPRLRRWQWTAALTSAAAAVLAAIMIFGPATTTPTPAATDTPQLAAADPLYAQVPIGDTGLRLDVTYVPKSETMVIAAIGLTPDGIHDHELWLVPADGSPLQSLGVVDPGAVHSMPLPADIARNLGDGAGLVLTVEPLGGKPEGEDAGPVVAEGTFAQV